MRRGACRLVKDIRGKEGLPFIRWGTPSRNNVAPIGYSPLKKPLLLCCRIFDDGVTTFGPAAQKELSNSLRIYFGPRLVLRRSRLPITFLIDQSLYTETPHPIRYITMSSDNFFILF